MKNKIAVIIAVALAIVCVAQQVWIIRLKESAAAIPAQPIAAPITYDTQVMSRLLVPPPGAVDSPSAASSSKFTGTGWGTGGQEGNLWIDTANVKIGRSADSRECRVAEVGWYYSKLIASAIPDARIVRSTGLPQAAEARSLHSVWLIHHPAGSIVVGAGYLTTGDGKAVGDVTRVEVLSVNNRGNTTWIP